MIIEEVLMLIMKSKHKAVIRRHWIVINYVDNVSTIYILLAELAPQKSSSFQVFQTSVPDAFTDDVRDV